MNFEKIKEELAAIEHERWSGWMEYLFSLCKKQHDGSLIIPSFCVEHWTRQSKFSYQELTEKEKESDREQVNSYWPIIEKILKEVGS